MVTPQNAGNRTGLPGPRLVPYLCYFSSFNADAGLDLGIGGTTLRNQTSGQDFRLTGPPGVAVCSFPSILNISTSLRF